jgi:hypothetical protein
LQGDKQMWNIFRILLIIILFAATFYFGIQGVISAKKYSISHIPTEQGSRLRALNFSASIISGFDTFVLYTHSTAGVPIFGIFLGLVWVEYWFNNLSRKNS